jgi:hypothetical protein
MTQAPGITVHGKRATELFWVQPSRQIPVELHHWEFDNSYREISHSVIYTDGHHQSINSIFAGRSSNPSHPTAGDAGEIPQEAASRRFVPFPGGFYTAMCRDEGHRPQLWPSPHF